MNSHSEGVLSDISGELIVKPCRQSEIDFYETTATHLDFKCHIPGFFGTLSLPSPAVTADVIEASNASSNLQLVTQLSVDAHTTIPPSQHWTPSNGGHLNTDLAIVLENVAAGFKHPNILDVKLGSRLWADDAPLAKRQKLDKAAEETTSKPLGFRIAGMKTWQGQQVSDLGELSSDGYRCYDKRYGRSLNPKTVRQAFEEYLFMNSAGVTKDLAIKVAHRFLKDLRDLQKTMENEESRMYSASLLFVYEGDGSALQDAFDFESACLEADSKHQTAQINDEDNEEDEEDEEDELQLSKVQVVKLIDFAHAKWTPGQGPDENLLHGVRNVIKFLEELKE